MIVSIDDKLLLAESIVTFTDSACSVPSSKFKAPPSFESDSLIFFNAAIDFEIFVSVSVPEGRLVYLSSGLGNVVSWVPSPDRQDVDLQDFPFSRTISVSGNFGTIFESDIFSRHIAILPKKLQTSSTSP